MKAIQYNNLNVAEIEEFVGEKVLQVLESESAWLAGVGPPLFSISIPTKDRRFAAMPGDWIIQDNTGFHVCSKNDPKLRKLKLEKIEDGKVL
jgi:hypothetical protein